MRNWRRFRPSRSYSWLERFYLCYSPTLHNTKCVTILSMSVKPAALQCNPLIPSDSYKTRPKFPFIICIFNIKLFLNYAIFFILIISMHSLSWELELLWLKFNLIRLIRWIQLYTTSEEWQKAIWSLPISPTVNCLMIKSFWIPIPQEFLYFWTLVWLVELNEFSN